MMISSYALALVCLLPLTSASSSSSLRGSLNLNPLDPTCLAAGMSSDDAQSLCDATTGTNGQACVWCNAAGVFGLCVSSDASASMGQYLDCDDSTEKQEDLLLLVEEEEEDLQSPLDPSCLLAGLQGGGDESTCTSAADQMGGACVWCTSPAAGDGVGLCLDADQADMAGQWLQCGGGSQKDELKPEIMEEEQVKSPLDPTCIMAGMQGGTKEGCLAAQDQDGGACEWCFPSQGDDSMGLCLNEDQADLVSQYLTCEEQHATTKEELVVQEKKEVASPLDPTCVKAMAADNAQEACGTTVDEEGASCIWCLGPTGDDSTGVCLSADQAAIAGQWLECQNHQGVQTVA